jgi:hypothetical protein
MACRALNADLGEVFQVKNEFSLHVFDSMPDLAFPVSSVHVATFL